MAFRAMTNSPVMATNIGEAETAARQSQTANLVSEKRKWMLPRLLSDRTATRNSGLGMTKKPVRNPEIQRNSRLSKRSNSHLLVIFVSKLVIELELYG
jgi:hypothetical protein